MKILVTGAGGWTARPILEALPREGHEVVALSFDAKGYHALHIIGSREPREHFDIGRTEEKLGFRPRVTFED